nr:cytochrome P450 [Tanacetum cinerariifolium]
MFRKHSVIVDEDGFLAIYGEWSNMGISCLMIIVYSPQNISSKCALWNRLCNLILSFHAMVIVLGDFNDVRKENENWVEEHYEQDDDGDHNGAQDFQEDFHG